MYLTFILLFEQFLNELSRVILKTTVRSIHWCVNYRFPLIGIFITSTFTFDSCFSENVSFSVMLYAFLRHSKDEFS